MPDTIPKHHVDTAQNWEEKNPVLEDGAIGYVVNFSKPDDLEYVIQQAIDAKHAALATAHGSTSAATASKIMQRDASGRAQVAAPSAAADIARKADVDAVAASIFQLCEFYYFRHPNLRPGFQSAQGGLLSNAATLYPAAWEYLQTTEGQQLCKSEAEWQAMTKATWATLADGTKVGWDGIGGAPFYAPDFATGTLRLPDLRGMYAEAAGYDSLGVGGVHGDAMRLMTGNFGLTKQIGNTEPISGVFFSTHQSVTISSGQVNPLYTDGVGFNTSRVVPTANKIQTRAWGALACVYLGT